MEPKAFHINFDKAVRHIEYINCCNMEYLPSKRQKATIDDTPGYPPSSPAPQNEGVLLAINDLTKLVESDPRLHSKLEGMLKDVLNRLKSVASATSQKEKNEDSCLIYKLSNDALELIFDYVGENQYGFVACVSNRFHHVYIDTFGGETLTSIESAAVLPSRAELCLCTEESYCNTRAVILFQAAVSDGKLGNF